VRPGCALAQAAWCALSAPRHRRFAAALARPRAAQEELLRALLARNRASERGRRLGFDGIAGFDAYRGRVPLSTWEDYARDVERIAAGERGVLTAEPVRLLEPTSGSSGPAKWIPYTRALARELRRAIDPWIVDLYARRPALLGGPAYWSISPRLAVPGAERSVVPVGFEDDADYLGGLAKRLVERALAAPSALRYERDLGRFRLLTLAALLRERELRLISVWHPSFLLLLLDALAERWDELLALVARGAPLEGGGRLAPARRARVAELRSLDPTRPDFARRAWPRLALVSAWGDAGARRGLAELAERLPGVELQAKGLIASEAVVSIPFRGERVLAIRSHVLELVDADGRARGAWEVERGGEYAVVVSTGGGLYRYRLRDRVRVTGFLGATPCVEFLGKEEGVSDLRGEKLDEAFVEAALARALEGLRPAPRFCLLAPDDDGPGGDVAAPRYALFVEVGAGDGEVAAQLHSLAGRLELELRANPHYAWCVDLGQLAPVRVRPVARDARLRYYARRARDGARPGDVKPAVLSRSGGWSEALGAP